MTAFGTRKLTDDELRAMYLAFFEARGHAVIPSASFVPEHDPSVLFISAGMHPLVPYLAGQPHPAGKRLVDYQKCLRTTDMEEVGNVTHLSFFEMLGNWSLGDYYKRESIGWSHEFLTGSEYLDIPLDRMWMTVFEGDDAAPRDDEAAQAWIDVGVKPDRIVYLGAEHNWWAAGVEGLCGPDTEIFVDSREAPCEKGDDCIAGVCSCGRWFEVWNNVFMSYDKRNGVVRPLGTHNVDTGMGVERTVAMINGCDSVYETPSLAALMRAITGTGEPSDAAPEEIRAMRIVTDHLRTAAFAIGDQHPVLPSNQERGYVVRRLIRRAVRFCGVIDVDPMHWAAAADEVVGLYGHAYPELVQNAGVVRTEIEREVGRFQKTLHRGTVQLGKEIERLRAEGSDTLSGEAAFRLYDTDGFPIEFTEELAGEAGFAVDREGFEAAFAAHREKSRGARAAGGLADDSVESVRYHTATHLLHSALREVLGDQLHQKGSNITRERLRFDFNHSGALTPEEIAEVERIVQEQIDAGIEVTREVVPIEEARRRGAIGIFDEKYEGDVSLYQIGDFSLEFCGGPHVTATDDLGKFKIVKEQSAGAGLRRIRAVLEPSH